MAWRWHIRFVVIICVIICNWYGYLRHTLRFEQDIERLYGLSFSGSKADIP